MAASAAAANSSETIDANNNGTTLATDGGVISTPFMWGDFFVTYNPPLAQRSEEWMRERAEELKTQVRTMFEDGKAMAAADVVTLVDTLERLGVDNHFREEIAGAVSRIHGDEREFVGSDLHVVATRFRLLRQHGLWVSTDVFDKFRDGTGNFSASLSTDPRGLLSLYNAAHMGVPGDADAALDDAIAFARRGLEAMKGKLRPPAAEQVARALDTALPRFMRQLETMHYIAEYEQEETHDGTLLELARLNFNRMKSLHFKELKALSVWWRDLYDTVKLTYARDRMVENYFMTCGMIHGEEYSRARMLFAKTFGLVSLLDDTYDAHATFEECGSLNEAVQRWDECAVSILPEYLRMLYIRTLRTFQEFEDLLEPNEKYRMSYAKKAYQLQSEYYMREAQWSNEKYRPSFEEHEELSAMSTGLPMLYLVGLMGYGAEATQEVFEWTSRLPDMVRASVQIGRFLNDLSSFKRGKTKNDISSAVECYMSEKGVTGEEAVAVIAAMTEHRWRIMNRSRMEMDRALLPAAELAVSVARTVEVIYLHGRDGYTYVSDSRDLVAAFFLDPVPLSNL